MAESIIPPITKEAARSAGLKHFFTGVPCAQGHVAKRLVSSGKCAECRRLKSARERASNPKYFSDYRKTYALINRERHIEYSSEWRKSNPDRCAAYKASWKSKNREQMRLYFTKYFRERYSADPAFRCIQRIRSRYQGALRRARLGKDVSLQSSLGYSGYELMVHIERQFVGGMSWDNRSKWHIDHIVPISQLLAEGVTDPAVINCLSNLRPVWAKENLQKGAKQTSLL